MAEKSPSSNGSKSTEPLQPLTERVRARVAEVGLALEDRARAGGRKIRRIPKTRQASSAKPQMHNPEAAREAQSIRVVFHELGDAHRQYRLRTGQHIPTALRDAGRAFKEAPNLSSLVLVAAFLDDAGILAW